MSESEAELSFEELEAILAEPDSPSQPRRSRKKKEDTEDRTIMGWFRLQHTSGKDCEVPDHDDERPRNKGMVVVIGDVAVCRECFLNERDRAE